MNTPAGVIRLVTAGLVLVVLTGMISVAVLAANGDVVPEVLGNITTTALGALAALLVSTRTGDTPSPTVGITHGTPTYYVNPVVDPTSATTGTAVTP
jgi:hypothetical protein